MVKKIILAYSGGLDTSVAVNILKKEYGYEVYCMTADLGNLPDSQDIVKRGLEAGAAEVKLIDAKKEMPNDWISCYTLKRQFNFYFSRSSPKYWIPKRTMHSNHQEAHEIHEIDAQAPSDEI